MLDLCPPDWRQLWGLTLAAGDGKRLQPFVEQLRGQRLPKQFINFTGRRSMLEHTVDRARKLIASERLITIVSRHHLFHAEVRRQLSRRPKGTVIVQPENKETLPGTLLPLLFLHRRCPGAVVALFPSDHFILQEERFMNYVRLAVQIVSCDPARLVLLAIPPRQPETEYGYILPRATGSKHVHTGAQPIAAFVEKPGQKLACQLMDPGGLWNTMTMIFKLQTLLDLARGIQPGLYRKFNGILDALDTPDEGPAIEELYRRLDPMNFSKELIERIAARHPERILALTVRGVYWNDWGCPGRIQQSLEFLRWHGLAARRSAKETAALGHSTGETMAL